MAAPEIRAFVKSPNSQDGAHNIVTDSTPQAGDTLLVIQGSDNAPGSTPNATCTDGALAQVGATYSDGNTQGTLRLFQRILTTSGAVTVGIPNAGGFDVAGIAVVLEGPCWIDPSAFGTSVVTSSSASFDTGSFSTTSADNMVLHMVMQLNGDSGSMEIASGIATAIGEAQAAPYFTMAAAWEAVEAAGSVPARTITWSGTPNKPRTYSIGVASPTVLSTFENGTDQHHDWFDTTVTRSTADANTGSASLLVQMASSFTGVELTNYPGYAVTSGATYQCSLWYKEATATMPTVNWDLQWIDGAGGLLRTDRQSLTRATTWTQKSTSLVAPAGAASLFWTFATSSGGSGPAYYIDDIMVLLTEQPTPSLNRGLLAPLF